MADTVIAASVQLDTGQANAASKELNKNLAQTKTSLNDVTKAANTTSESVGGSTTKFGKLKEQMGALPGPLGSAGEGVNKLSGAFKALLANPVGLVLTAIVAVLALLYKAFTNTFEGGQKMEQVFAGIKAAGQALLDNLEKIGSAIVKLMKFDFSGAIKDIKDVAQAASDAFNAMAKLTAQAQELHKEQLANDLDAAKRERDLAVLRSKANDESTPIKERLASLKELREASEQNAKEDIDLAKRTADNKIAQLTLEKDGERKNQDEINQIRIEQIKGETENANELRAINKQITNAEKQEQAERKENAAKAAEAQKAERQKLVEFTNKLTALQQENELSAIQNGYDRELKALQNKIDAEKRANALAVQDKKINREQQAQLDAALDIKYNLEKGALDKKRNEEQAQKEADFQKELSAVRSKTAIDSLTDQREIERTQLEIGYQEKLRDAIQHYKDDTDKLNEFKTALDAQYAAEKAKQDEKNRKEDAKAAFELESQRQQAVIDANDFDFQAKLAAVDAEQALVQKAFDDKLITELDYNSKTQALSQARMTIRDQERQHNEMVTSAIGDAFGALSEIAGKQTALGKALAIAQTTISTYQSAIGAFRGMVTTIPGPVGIALGVVAAAGALATGIAAVKKIVSVQVPGQGGGSGSTPAGLPTQAAPVAPTQASTKIDSSSIQGIGDASKGAVKTFVVDADTGNARDRQARLERAATLGG